MTIEAIVQTDGTYAGQQKFPPTIIVDGNPTAQVWTTAACEAVKDLKTGIWSGETLAWIMGRHARP